MVIQRWQTVLLLIAAGVMVCFTFMSLGQIQLPEYTYNFTTIGLDTERTTADGGHIGYVAYTWGFFMVSLLSFLIPLIAIFCYKKMALQKTLCLIEVMFLLAVTAIGMIYGYYHFQEARVEWSPIIAAPLLAIIADLFAYNRICADGRKLRAADRLR